MPRAKLWNLKTVGPGIGEVRLSNWKQFPDFVYQAMLDHQTYVWRGQRCDSWNLEPTLGRIIREAKIARTKQYDFATNHLETFKLAVRGRRGSAPPKLEADDDWWALGQHHGLATPLLDWTTSPFVAAYFAYIDQGQVQTPKRAIYALHQPTVETWAREKAFVENTERMSRFQKHERGEIRLGMLEHSRLQARVVPEVQFIRPLSDENHRLVSQGGLFTRAPTGSTLEDWIAKHHPDGDEDTTLIRVLVPNRDRESALRMLNRMNINHLSLFPDLSGASKFCNLHSEIDRY